MSMPGDITFDSGTSYFGANLTSAVQQGMIPANRVDDMGKAIFTLTSTDCRLSVA